VEAKVYRKNIPWFIGIFYGINRLYLPDRLSKTSFFKDVFLLIPAIIVLLKHKDWHQLFSSGVRSSIMVLSTLGLLLYCFSNFSWDIPHTDFRPFQAGKNIKAERTAQLDAMGSVKILTWVLQNKADGKVAAIEANKISEMEFSSFDGYDLTEEILDDPEASFLIVAHKMYSKGFKDTKIVKDSIFTADTIIQVESGEVVEVLKRLDRVEEKEISFTNYKWDEDYLNDWKETIKPLADKAAAKGVKLYVVSGGTSEDVIESLVRETGIKATFLTADDILLKTIVRSNPGIVLWKNGSIVNKWHKSKFPGFDKSGL